jgi:hypothetical protein
MTPTENQTQSQSVKDRVQQQVGTHPMMWAALAMGAGAGLAALVARSREETVWEKTTRRTGELVDGVREGYEPWMGIAAGATAAAVGILTYTRRNRETAWERAGKRASQVANMSGKELRTWAGLAAMAISMASAYGRRQASNDRLARNVKKRAAATLDQTADIASRMADRIHKISEEARSLYPRVQKMLA